MNLLELQQECGRLLSDPDNQRWSASILTTRLNLAQTEVQGYTNAVKTDQTLTLISGSSSYTVDDDTMNVLMVILTDSSLNAKRLDGITREELDFRYPNWQQFDAGTPFTYIFQASSKEIVLIPAPDYAISGGGGLFARTSNKPADMVNSTDLPFDSNVPMIPYHMSIVHWTVAQCWMDDGTPESLAKSRFHKTGDIDHPGQYELQLERIIKTFDVPTDVPAKVLWKPQGGRLGSYGMMTKAYPFRY